ncbi:Uncharacterized protein Adt_42095 [Abeliophyllum distichum]|uniref:BZIP transcription factor n=1 Tax=Abeliophyllum distichum TaxID=126358 RepID=A0ABD1PRJ1_9LAMI
MVTLLSSQQHTDNEGQSDDGGDRPQVLTPDDVANEILGTRSSYYIGLGRGPKPPKKTCRASSAQHENVELRQMVQTQQSQLTFAREKIGILEKQNNAIIALLDQLMPGAAEKLTTLTNLASPTPNIADP